MISTWIAFHMGLCFVHFCLFCSDPDCECAQLIGVLEEEREVAKVDKSWWVGRSCNSLTIPHLAKFQSPISCRGDRSVLQYNHKMISLGNHA